MTKKRRMFYNDDGNSSMSNYAGPMRPQIATDAVDVLLGTPITTLVYCVVPTEDSNYPSDVTSMLGWRRTKFDYSGWYKRLWQFYQDVRRLGWDIPKMVMDRAAEKGFEFVASMRMNDAHFGQKATPQDNPLTAQFWTEHQDLVIGPATFKRWGNEHLLDFTHKAVRDFKLALAFEAMDRYAVDGFEMDWTRHYTFFKPGQEQPELLTEMVRQVRKHLDERGRKAGKKLPLLMRVAPSIQASLECGLDTSAWIREGLVDYLIPSTENRYIALNMPIWEWVDLVKGTDVEVHPSPDSAAPRGDGQATLQMYRAAASNYYSMGAHGFYLFNLFCQGYPHDENAYSIMRDVCDPDALSRRDKFFTADTFTWRSDADSVPVKLEGSKDSTRVGVWVGDDLATAREETSLKRVALRVRIDNIEPEDRLQVTLNDKPLDMKAARVFVPTHRQMIAFNASIPSWTVERSALGSNPGIWFEFDLSSTLPRRGDNTITVRRICAPMNVGKYATQVVNVDIPVEYHYCGKDDLVG